MNGTRCMGHAIAGYIIIFLSFCCWCWTPGLLLGPSLFKGCWCISNLHKIHIIGFFIFILMWMWKNACYIYHFGWMQMPIVCVCLCARERCLMALVVTFSFRETQYDKGSKQYAICLTVRNMHRTPFGWFSFICFRSMFSKYVFGNLIIFSNVLASYKWLTDENTLIIILFLVCCLAYDLMVLVKYGNTWNLQNRHITQTHYDIQPNN